VSAGAFLTLRVIRRRLRLCCFWLPLLRG